MAHPARITFLTSLACVLRISAALASTETPPADADVAVLGNEHVTFGQLPSAAQNELQENQRRYDRQVHQLAIDHKRELQAIVESHANRFLDDKVMQAEAQARGVKVEEISKEIKVPEVSDAEVREFYLANQQQIGQPFAAVSSQLAQYLRQQAAERSKRSYIDGLRTKYAARTTVEPLREAVPALGPSRGPKDAPVTIVEFSDFECPFCRKMAPLLKQLQDKYPQDVRLVYRQLPLPDLHPNAMSAAKASLCASEQGKFWEMHDALFADQSALGTEGLKKTADQLHLKTKVFESCLASPKVAAAVEADTQAGVEYGVSGTPGLFINGRFVNGAVPFEMLVGIVEDELKRHQSTQAVAKVSENRDMQRSANQR